MVKVGRGLIGLAVPVLMAWAMGSSVAWSADKPKVAHVGRAEALVPGVNVRLGNEAPARVTQDQLLLPGQLVATDPDGALTIRLRDGTTVQLGSNAAITLDEFVFNPVQNVTQKRLTVMRGAFSYVSGVVTKTTTTEIRSPVATIGIRGSVMQGVVLPDAPALLYLPVGSATVSNKVSKVEMKAGDSVIVRSINEPIVGPEDVPPGLAAHIIAYIQKSLEKLPTKATRPNDNIMIADGRADLMPIQDQKSRTPTKVDQDAVDRMAANDGLMKLAMKPLTAAHAEGLLGQGEALRQFLASRTMADDVATRTLQRETADLEQANQTNIMWSSELAVRAVARSATRRDDLGATVSNVIEANPKTAALVVSAAVKASEWGDYYQRVATVAAAATKVLPDETIRHAENAVNALPTERRAKAAGFIATALINQRRDKAAEIAQAMARLVPESATDIALAAKRASANHLHEGIFEAVSRGAGTPVLRLKQEVAAAEKSGKTGVNVGSEADEEDAEAEAESDDSGDSPISFADKVKAWAATVNWKLMAVIAVIILIIVGVIVVVVRYDRKEKAAAAEKKAAKSAGQAGGGKPNGQGKSNGQGKPAGKPPTKKGK